ncbi:MAG TPA: MFS transporter [Candidatus Thermoplasmatota archaeon]|nr:MFS transporter [Candidatus Thermoplasmatota archaeon]
MSSVAAPLRNRVFLALWIASVTSHVGTWMSETGTTLVMTDLTSSPLVIALVSASTSLALLLVSLPAGTLADVVDRRKLLLASQAGMTVVAVVYAYMAYTDMLTPGLLLAATFAIGVGSAVSLPAWEASIPEIVGREHMASALTLDSIGINVGRALGPATAGIVVALVGAWLVFLLDAVTFVALFVAVLAWKPAPVVRSAAPERFTAAIRGGARYVRHSPAFRAVLVRTAAFTLAASALWGLLGVRLRIGLGFESLTYGLIVGAFGAGAILTAFVLPKLRRRYNADVLTLTSTVLMAGLLVAIALLASPLAIGACMLVGGGAWIAQMSGLNVAAQFATASWVRGRALSMYAVVFQGSMFVGTTTWGSIASWWTTRLALLIASGVLLAGMVLAIRYRLAPTEKMDLTPSMHWPRPQLALDASQSDLPAFVTIEYEVDPSDHGAFMAAMQDVRRMRLRDGASSWGVFHEPETPRILMECFQVPSWTEHLRQHDRITKQDLASEATVRRFHRGDSPPKIRHFVAPRT